MKAKYRVLLIVLSFLFVLSGIFSGGLLLFQNNNNDNIDNLPLHDAATSVVFDNKYISDLRNWSLTGFPSSFKSITYNSSINMSTVNVDTVNGWEIICIPIAVERNKNYRLGFNYIMPVCNFGSDGVGLPLIVTNSMPSGATMECYSISIERIYIGSGVSGRALLNFNSGENDTVYLSFNFGYIYDGQNLSYSFGNFDIYSPINNDYWTDAGNYGTTPWQGAGTESNPWLIQSEQDLARLAYLIYYGQTGNTFTHSITGYQGNYSGKYFRQTRDLDLSAHYWQAIGVSANRNNKGVLRAFSGKYDGCGYKISGLITEEFYTKQGLFGFVMSKSSDEYTLIKNVIIDETCYIRGKDTIGAVAGDPYYYIHIENCKNYATVSANNIVGAISGFLNYNCIIKNCQNYGNIFAATDHIGGIVGHGKNGSRLENCINYGNISGRDNVGGISGLNLENTNTISCENFGYVYGSGNYVAGITAYVDTNSNTEYCRNYGNVFGIGCAVGGINGKTIDSKINYCSNSGKIESRRSQPAGISGQNHKTSTIIYGCYNEGDVIVYGDEAGGIAGYLTSGAQIVNCYNVGLITCTCATLDPEYISAGGIVGNINNGVVKNSYNAGAVLTYSGITGGLVGEFMRSGYCYNSINIGSVNSKETAKIGSVCGLANQGQSWKTYCFNYSAQRLYGVVNSEFSCSQRVIEDFDSTIKNRAWFVNNDNWNSELYWDFDNVWTFVEGLNNGLPVLQWATKKLELDTNGGEFDAEGYVDNETHEINGVNYINLGRKYFYTDKIYMSIDAYLDNWNLFSVDQMALISNVQSGGCGIKNSGGFISFTCYDKVKGGYVNAKSNIQPSVITPGWHNFEGTFDGNYARLYIDGILYAISSKYAGNQIKYHESNALFIGAEAGDSFTTPSPTDIFPGIVKNIKILHTAKNLLVQNNQEVGYLPNVTREGYGFDGWYTEKDGGVEIRSETIWKPYYDTSTLYAHWTGNPYTISYKPNGASGTMRDQNFVYGTKQSLTKNAFTKTGYTFAGWATSLSDANAGIVTYTDGQKVLNLTTEKGEVISLYPVWTINKYNILYVANGALGSMDVQTVNYNVETNLTENNFVKTGFEFLGWATSQQDADLGNVTYLDEATIENLSDIDNDTIVLFAVWKKVFTAEYDAIGDFWYVEIGSMPQSRVSQSLNTALNEALANHSLSLVETENVYKVSNNLEMTGYMYKGNEYCKNVELNQWYKVEQIRWRLAGTYEEGQIVSGGVNAILDSIVYIDTYSSGTTEYSITVVDAFSYNLGNNGNNMSNLIAFTPADLAGREDKIYIASEAEIQAIAGSYDVKFSDLVCDIVGTRYYYTRTPANDGNMRVYSYLGFASASAPTYQHGVQFVVKVSEFVCI